MQFERQIYVESQEEMDIMPIVPLTEDEMSDEDKKKLPKELIILSIRNMVLFPNVVLPITVSREKSIKALNDAEKSGKYIGVISQKDSTNDDPSYDDINAVGTVAEIIKQIKMTLTRYQEAQLDIGLVNNLLKIMIIAYWDIMLILFKG